MRARRQAPRCVSKDGATQLENALVSPFGGAADNHLFWDEKTAQSGCASAKIEKLQPLFLRRYLRHYRHAGTAPVIYGIIMLTAKFEPFGELLPENGLGKREQPKASAILSAVGQGCFWLLVVAIVATRVAYFSPAPSFAPHTASALIHSAQR
jgi:hypothetical protein